MNKALQKISLERNQENNEICRQLEHSQQNPKRIEKGRARECSWIVSDQYVHRDNKLQTGSKSREDIVTMDLEMIYCGSMRAGKNKTKKNKKPKTSRVSCNWALHHSVSKIMYVTTSVFVESAYMH